jgi:hypothetical protein
VQHASPGLAALATDLRDMICDTALEAAVDAEAIVLAQPSEDYSRLAQVLMTEDGRDVIDLVRAFAAPSQQARYQGIGW